MIMEGRESALVGLGSRCGQPILAVYDRDLLLESFISDGMSAEEAEEWIGINVEGAWVGEHTPIIMERIEQPFKSGDSGWIDYKEEKRLSDEKLAEIRGGQ